MKLGEKIKLVRKHRGLTQRELGERLHLDGNAANRIAQYESGFRTPKEGRIQEIARVLNVRKENFFTRAETPEDIIRTLIWYDWEHDCGGSVPIDAILLFDNFEEVEKLLKEWYSQKEKLRTRKITGAEYLEWMLTERKQIVGRMEQKADADNPRTICRRQEIADEITLITRALDWYDNGKEADCI